MRAHLNDLHLKREIFREINVSEQIIHIIHSGIYIYFKYLSVIHLGLSWIYSPGWIQLKTSVNQQDFIKQHVSGSKENLVFLGGKD